jgi:hypothetical protein
MEFALVYLRHGGHIGSWVLGCIRRVYLWVDLHFCEHMQVELYCFLTEQALTLGFFLSLTWLLVTFSACPATSNTYNSQNFETATRSDSTMGIFIELRRENSVPNKPPKTATSPKKGDHINPGSSDKKREPPLVHIQSTFRCPPYSLWLHPDAKLRQKPRFSPSSFAS